MAGSLGESVVVPLLRGRFGRPYRFVSRCPSTQRLLADDAPEGAVVATDEQTDGRGRLGRAWIAPAATSVLVSIRLLPRVATDRLPALSPLAGHAVAEAVAERTGLETTVKSPNDVLVGGRKVAGVLAEASDGRVTLGIGLNVSQSSGGLPPDTRLPATSLLLESGRDHDRAELLAAVLDHLERRYDAWQGAQRS